MKKTNNKIKIKTTTRTFGSVPGLQASQNCVSDKPKSAYCCNVAICLEWRRYHVHREYKKSATPCWTAVLFVAIATSTLRYLWFLYCMIELSFVHVGSAINHRLNQSHYLPLFRSFNGLRLLKSRCKWKKKPSKILLFRLRRIATSVNQVLFKARSLARNCEGYSRTLEMLVIAPCNRNMSSKYLITWLELQLK